MKQAKVESLLVALGSKKTGQRGKWVEGYCPFAFWTHLKGKDAHPSFAIKAEENKKSICKCLSCGEGGDLMDMMFKLHGFNKKHPNPAINFAMVSNMVSNEADDLELTAFDIPEYGVPAQKTDVVFPEQWLKTFRTAKDFPEAMKYLRSRWVTKEVVDALEIKFDPLQRRICFPFRNFKGELMGVQGRSIDDIPHNDLRYYQYGYKDQRNLHIWMGEHTLNMDMPVVLCEGPFDYTSIRRVYPNVAASFTSGLSLEKLKRMSDAESIVTFYDYGSGGDAARKRIKEVFKGMPITNVIPTEEQDDAGAMSEEDVAEALEGLVPLA